jgi:hypothetical protein
MMPLEQGGVQVPEREARRMASVVKKMMTHADDIRRFRARKDSDGVFFSQDKLAERLKDHLIGTYRIKLSTQQDENMTEMIADRVTGVTEKDDFLVRAMDGVRKGGLGLAEKEADELARYFEKVIAQGVDISYKS